MKVVIWGHPLHSHTHSYIHAAFYKAFKAMGHDAHWMDGTSSGIPFFPSWYDDALFLTEGQVDKHIPIRKSARYILHNCEGPRYADIPQANKVTLQVLTNDCIARGATRISDTAYYQDCCLYQPWATDLLPEEINLDWATAPRKRETHWVGTVGAGRFGNEKEIAEFRRACSEDDIAWIVHHNLPFEENRRVITGSMIAPAIHGTWQCEKGYVACRLFKNVSYGQLAVTNCEGAYKYLGIDTCVFNKDPYAMAKEALRHVADANTIRDQMKLVRDKHTYVTRIKTLLAILEMHRADYR